MSRKITIQSDEEEALIGSLNKRTDVKAERIKKFLALPDLTKKEKVKIRHSAYAL
mgnify:CR=1 FL=1